MAEFTDAAREIAEAFNTDLAEQIISMTYTEILTDTTHGYRGIADSVNITEIDGESVVATTGKYFCLQHELPIEPQIDDTLTINGRVYRIARVTPVDNVVGWYIYANA